MNTSHLQPDPHVTVLMPIFNAMPYLPLALESVLAQTHGDLTVLALDDGSSDGSLEYLRGHPDGRVQAIGDGRHHGLGTLLNHGISMARGELIARMDADDLCPPDRFARQVAALREDPGLVAIGTQFQYMGTAGRLGFARRLPLDHASIHRDLRRGMHAVVHASLMMRTAQLSAIGGYRFAGLGEDWDMFLRLAEVGRFGNLPQIGYFYRLHATNATALHQRLAQRRIRFACDCAEARRLGQPEPEEAAWLASLEKRPWYERWCEAVDSFGVARYFSARYQVLNGRPIRGYANFALGIMASPHRVASRLANRIKSFTGKPRAARPIPT